MTEWVSPEQGCNYCHTEDGDFASDGIYTKVVARRMLQMTQHLNSNWKTHVGATGVNCYTCHRGQPVPTNIWFTDPGRPHAQGMAGNPAGQNAPAPGVGLASLPNDPFTPFLAEANDIRVVSTTAVPGINRHSIKQTEWTYGLMMHMSNALGVNCTYCHNTRSFTSWDQSNPAADHGLVRHPDAARRERELSGAAEAHLPARSAWALGRCAEGQLHHLPPGRLQAALWR